MLNPVVEQVTAALEQRSAARRARYLARLDEALQRPPLQALGCSNLAHALAAQDADARLIIKQGGSAHIAIVSSYNDLLSAHAPLREYPERLKQALARQGATAQFAAGVPAMCDGITQGEAGMQLSLFSRDLIAQATAIGLCHGIFDGALYLGVCDKIVPGLLIGALQFGHLPAVFVPAGPMHSGLANKEKASVRQRYARGEVGRDELLRAELASYHEAGTCTFYGTANTNQLLMEAMGLHVPGSAFVHPYTPLRDALNDEAARLVVRNSAKGERFLPVGRQIDARVLVNALAALLASGGSTNHGLHLPAIARAAGYELVWEDFAALSQVVPLLARVYPNGAADVNQFQAAGGPAWIIRELLDAGLMHGDVATVVGHDLADYAREPWLDEGRLAWRALPAQSAAPDIVRPVAEPFSRSGGFTLLEGNLGRAMLKTSAVDPAQWHVRAPARVFACESAVQAAYQAGELTGDLVLVVRFQGPRANGMPELHKLMPLLANLQAAGQRVALVTDGRLSGASGQVPAALHVTPEAAAGGALARLQDGDMLEVDALAGVLRVELSPSELAARPFSVAPSGLAAGFGLELFASQRRLVGPADRGASIFDEGD
ncbi:phosphogluconate dehydratase [Aquipseudomonas guryensis]|jgi:phosphogluconate dehydratase|uniref:Phosphogluconate dehydratase n=1 Tax=Aquipseudomonas guryensis TaxID=2759165 RepID=A0A7W4DAV9_9GAMM|nr:phosphogluconate dehydratase [Pseudomonas guryensis]MBB1519212.1 phosphogluconate dehydratase [Pseudomonas guryensis]